MAFIGLLPASQAINTADIQPTLGCPPAMLSEEPPLLCSWETTEEAALTEKYLPDIFQNIIFRVLAVCPLCIGISTSVRRAWESRTVVTACPSAGCASRRLVWCLLKLLLAMAPGLGFLLTLLALQMLTKEKTTRHSCATSPREHSKEGAGRAEGQPTHPRGAPRRQSPGEAGFVP